jgi:TP901 family phage tail tape measure protein
VNEIVAGGSKNEAKIKFTAETSDFTQSIKDANSEISSLRAEMKLNEAQFQNTGDSAEYLQTKQELLEAQLESNKDKQEALTSKLEVAKEIYGDDSEEVAKLERQLTYAQTEEQKLLKEVNDLNGGLDDQEKAADDAGESIDSMAEILVNAGIADTIKEIAEAAAGMAEEYDEASAAIVEGTGASGEALDELNEAAKDAFGKIADSDADLTSVSNILAELNTRFGVTGEEATDMTTKIEKFADHTGTDGVKAVDAIADITKRWGLDIEDTDSLLDDLTTANQSCQMSVDDLTGYLINNSTQFQELGYSTEEALGMLIGLSDGGANVSSIMGGMTKAITNLSGVTDDVPGTFRQAIEAIGDCDNVSEALQAQVGDTGLTIEDIFGKKAAQELATNVQNGSFAVEEWTTTLQDNQGALDNTAEGATTMQDALDQASNNVKMALSSTLSPAISDVVIAFSGVITKVAQVVQDTPALQAVLVAVTVALAALAAALGISSLISMVQQAFTMLNATMLMNPIFLVVTALVALTAGIVYAYQNCEEFRDIIDQAFSAINNTVLTVLSAVKDFVTDTFGNIKSSATTIWNQIKTAIADPIDTAKGNVINAIDAIKSVFDLESLKSSVSDVFDGIKTGITTPIENAKNTLSGLVGDIKGFFSNLSLKIPTPSLPTLPHFKLKTSSKTILGKEITYPTGFDVEWYAKGAVFNAATILPTLSGFKGVGEAEPEAVAPISVLQDYVTNAVENANNENVIDYDKLADKMAYACANMNISLNIGGRQAGRIIREVM